MSFVHAPREPGIFVFGVMVLIRLPSSHPAQRNNSAAIRILRTLVASRSSIGQVHTPCLALLPMQMTGTADLNVHEFVVPATSCLEQARTY